jgi:hypothetical protein
MGIIFLILGCFSFVAMMWIDIFAHEKRYYAFLFYLAIGMQVVAIIGQLIFINRLYVNTYYLSIRIIFIILVLFFLSLEIYSVFFAVKAGGDSVRDTGVYALCRHPGMLWYAGLCFCLTIAFNLPLYIACIYTALNFIYIYIQDSVVFPRDISGYNEYKRRTPFFPTHKSLISCLSFYLEKGKENNAS